MKRFKKYGLIAATAFGLCVLGGSKLMMIGDVIETMFVGDGCDYNVGAALSLVLMWPVRAWLGMYGGRVEHATYGGENNEEN